MILYHGSDKIIKHPALNKGRVHNDYGQGFYCTRHIELAKEWAVSEDRDGFVNVYEIDIKKLKLLDLNSDKYGILHWLTLLIDNRTVKAGSPIAEDGMIYLKKNYSIDISDYDGVIGYRADDSYFSFARAFLSNTISIAQLEQAMYLGDLGVQYFLKSKKAFELLTYRDSVTVDHLEYYPLKVSRDKKARDDYSHITGSLNKEEVYLIDLIRRDS